MLVVGQDLLHQDARGDIDILRRHVDRLPAGTQINWGDSTCYAARREQRRQK